MIKCSFLYRILAYSGYLYLVVPQILVENHPNKSEKIWADLNKKKKKDWKPRDHEYFGKLDLWVSRVLYRRKNIERINTQARERKNTMHYFGDVILSHNGHNYLHTPL